jgi:hypothetical protein
MEFEQLVFDLEITPPRSKAQEAYEEVFGEIIPEALEFFRSKTTDYSSDVGFLMLGAKGQFSDITRKWLKLYRAVWEGIELEGEQPDEIAADFFGHSMLLLYCLKKGL